MFQIVPVHQEVFGRFGRSFAGSRNHLINTGSRWQQVVVTCKVLGAIYRMPPSSLTSQLPVAWPVLDVVVVGGDVWLADACGSAKAGWQFWFASSS